ncbi:hypothetical protein [Halomonas sp. BM-2019]|nr:MAG: hypothetical protein J5F18_03845 [Halomonas sp. BM-2019]
MKILICPDSFKDALPAEAAARAIAIAIACGVRGRCRRLRSPRPGI